VPLTAQQIVTLACQDARCPSFTAQAGQLLNSILSDLCQTYDFEVCRTTFNFSFNNALPIGTPGRGTGTGPYELPNDYLRMRINDFFYTIMGVPYFLVPLDLEEYDSLVQTAGFNDFPRRYATDLSPLSDHSPWSSGFGPGFGPLHANPLLYVWPPASGSYPATMRYYRQMPDIATPETAALVPWFPNQSYLLRELAGRLMGLTDDERMAAYMGSDEDQTPNGSGVLLKRYLKLEGDRTSRAQTVKLDRRYFGSSDWSKLRNTKLVGW